MSDHYTVTALHASAAQVARATRYSTLEAAWGDVRPGTVVRDAAGEVVAGHADTLAWLTPANVAGWSE